jgi:hypothetical protein
MPQAFAEELQIDHESLAHKTTMFVLPEELLFPVLVSSVVVSIVAVLII